MTTATATKTTPKMRRDRKAEHEKTVQDMTVAVERFTPDMAREALDHPANADNRRIDLSRVRMLKASMIEGTFQLNAETVKFAADGGLIDGQHRLTAIVESGKAQDLLVARNVPKSAFATIPFRCGTESKHS